MIDIAIGVIIGAAFNKVIDSLVKDVFTPIMEIAVGVIDFSYLSFSISDSHTIVYGRFIQSLIDFLIIAITVFIVVKIMNGVRRKAQDVEDKSVVTPKDIELLTDLKSLLQQQNEILRKSI